MFIALSKFLSSEQLLMNAFSNIFFLSGQLIFVKFFHPICILLLISFIYIKNFFITITIE